MPRHEAAAFVQVIACKSGFRPAREQVSIDVSDAGQGITRLEVVLSAGECVVGRVMSRGRPGQFARVHGVVAGDDMANVMTWSDASGRFALGVGPGKQIQRAIVNHGEFGCADIYVGDHARSVDVGVVELSELDPLVGRVVTRDGRGSPGLPLLLVLVGESVRVPRLGETVWNVTTDESGGFRLYGMRDGQYTVTFSGAMIDDLWRDPKTLRKSAIEERLVLDVVRVRLLVEQDGVPVPEWAVFAEWVPSQALGDAEASKKWNRLGPAFDRLVPMGSAWSVKVRRVGGAGEGTWAFVAVGSDEIEGRIRLR